MGGRVGGGWGGGAHRFCCVVEAEAPMMCSESEEKAACDHCTLLTTSCSSRPWPCSSSVRRFIGYLRDRQGGVSGA